MMAAPTRHRRIIFSRPIFLLTIGQRKSTTTLSTIERELCTLMMPMSPSTSPYM